MGRYLATDYLCDISRQRAQMRIQKCSRKQADPSRQEEISTGDSAGSESIAQRSERHDGR